MTKPLTTSHLLLALALAMLFSCSNLEFDNSLDPKAKSYVGSSSSEVSSSSFEEGSSSSSEYVSSSSGEQGSSSSERSLSSSSAESSSSSVEQSSSSLGCGGNIPGGDAFCWDGLIHQKCGGNPYNPTTSICENGSAIIARCNNETYNPLEHRCESNILNDRCGIGDKDFYKPDKYTWYDPATHFCTKSENNPEIVPLCEGIGYDTKRKFCYNNSKIVDYCGNRTETFDPDIYGCKPNINANGIYLKNKPEDAAGKEYEAVLIGSQTWMAENLNYNATNSKCGGGAGSTLSDDNTTICDTYGRLYKWSTAMDLGASCDSEDNDCGDDIQEKHQGICPTGWHIPSDNDWKILMSFAHEDNAGKYLKAVNGWSDSGNGTDDYGFSALPGGLGTLSNSLTGNVGSIGNWWSAGGCYYYYEGTCLLYGSGSYRYMGSSSEKLQTNTASSQKANVIYSVRCVKNE